MPCNRSSKHPLPESRRPRTLSLRASPVLALGLLLAAGCAAGPTPLSESVELVLLGTTDVHGHLYAYDYARGRETDHGLALLKPVVDRVRAANPGRVYLFDSGDLLQGNMIGYVFATREPDRPSPIVRAMNLMGYTASVIGNHEFNFGLPNLDRAIAAADFPFFAANVFRAGTDEHAYTPYMMIPHVVAEGDTIRIGVTGSTPPGSAVWDMGHVAGVLEFRDVIESLSPAVRALRDAGADVVVLVSHAGIGTGEPSTEMGLPGPNEMARAAHEIPGIDVIFLGHTHRALPDTVVNGVLLTGAGAHARSLAAVSLRLDRRTGGGWQVASKSARLLEPTPGVADTAFMEALRWEHERTLEWAEEVVGRSIGRMESTTARAEPSAVAGFVNHVQREATGAQLSASSVFDPRATLPEGEVRVRDLSAIYPYDNNTLRMVEITGHRLKAYLEQVALYYRGWPPRDGESLIDPAVFGFNFDVVSGVDYTIDLGRPAGDRITGLAYRGQPVRPDDTYTLALNNYRQAGGGDFPMLADLPVLTDRTDLYLIELLADHVRRRGVIRPEDYLERNWRIVPEAAAEAARAELAGGPGDGRP
jgi:2',3'-cyclic-nucleotide 2'-phosphodiesterase (5'-nucleotidase family)